MLMYGRRLIRLADHFKPASLRPLCSPHSHTNTLVNRHGSHSSAALLAMTQAEPKKIMRVYWEDRKKQYLRETENDNRGATWAIRRHLFERRHEKQWGLTIFRCTYASQERWEKYISIIHDCLLKSTDHDNNGPLREAMNFPVVEDADALDGATWKQARTRFDEWVLNDMKVNPLPPYTIPPSTYYNTDGRSHLDYEIHRAPRWEHFIYADKASVDSVVDNPDEYERIGKKGVFWTTVATTGLVRPRNWFEDENGKWVPDYEDKEEEEYQIALYQKVQVHNLVQMYSTTLRGNFIDCMPDENGISDAYC